MLLLVDTSALVAVRVTGTATLPSPCSGPRNAHEKAGSPKADVAATFVTSSEVPQVSVRGAVQMSLEGAPPQETSSVPVPSSPGPKPPTRTRYCRSACTVVATTE